MISGKGNMVKWKEREPESRQQKSLDSQPTHELCDLGQIIMQFRVYL